MENNIVLELISSYEKRVLMMEEVINSVYGGSTAFNGSLGELDREREKLINNLGALLSKNCSLRRKDFRRMIEGVLSESESKRKEIDEKERGVRQKLADYIEGQKKWAASIKEMIAQFTQGKISQEELEAIINNLKANFQHKGEEVFLLLNDFQSNLKAFQREQEEINHRLQRLMERGESLKVEDLRQIEAAKSGQERRVDRKRRQEEVKKLLAHYERQRLESKNYRRW